MKPSSHGDEYVNRKGFPSINVQATCDNSEMFTSVDASWPGSVHDARIWRNSDVYRILRENQCNALILGDEGYGIAPWLMTPFQNPETPDERAYNRLHSKERVIIEWCFGQVKRRFPILQNKIRLAQTKIPSVIIACFVLHNVAKHLGDEDFEAPSDDNNLPVLGEEEAANVRVRGTNRRREIVNVIRQLDGEVDAATAVVYVVGADLVVAGLRVAGRVLQDPYAMMTAVAMD
ncbi:putative nuclease HARBI1 [Schistocerca piceifrons]|uniref:putative nuclease HARBI1 n=1 Tax=Schistocerca piceifrons TaxID=274613 RepID=UPI001F5EF370|nr:putative nuclease HARBI1 [Schistocerca piceifrons]